MHFKRMLIAVLTAACLCVCCAVPASAQSLYSASDDEISLCYEIANNPTSNLNILGQTAYCVSETTGVNTSSISVEQKLERYSGWFSIWNTVDGAEWSDTTTSNCISLYNNISGLSSGTYRLKSVFTLTSSSGKSEKITIYSSDTLHIIQTMGCFPQKS